MNLETIAKLSGVSKTTASLVLNGKAKAYRVSPKTAEKVEKIAEENNYVANALARGLRQNKSDTLGLIVPDIENPFFSSLAKSIEYEAWLQGKQVFVASHGEDVEKEKKLIAHFKNRRVDGIVLASASEAMTESKSVPFIFIDRKSKNKSELSITSNNYQSAFDLCAHLIGTGVKHLLLIGGDAHTSTSIERKAGFDDAVAKAGIGSTCFEGGFNAAWGYEAAKKFFDAAAVPTGIFTTAYPVLEGVLTYLKQASIKPSALTLATMDDHPLLDHVIYQVASARQDTNSMAKKIFSAIFSTTEKNNQVVTDIQVPAKLIYRDSK